MEWIDGGRVAGRIEAVGPLIIGRGRDCDLCLDPGDRGISRRAAALEPVGGGWMLVNCSSSRTLQVREPTGLGSLLHAGSRRALPAAGATIVVTGLRLRHGIRVALTRRADASAVGVDEGDDPTLDVPTPTPAEREALLALASGYLAEFPRWDPVPLSYADAGRRLGLRTSTVRKRIEGYRERLARVGIAGGELQDARAAVVEAALAGGVL